MTWVFYLFTGVAFLASLLKSKEKTKKAMIKAWRAFENILPQFSAILLLIGIMLAGLTPQQISSLLGDQAGFWGVLLAIALGAITLMPGFVAFPLAAALLQNGAGTMQIAAFISSLMMVGIITMPMEIQYFGRKGAFLRNGLALVFSLIVAVVMGVVFR
ncbi:MAG: permease [Firmicutes bacterium]|nr:permease [Bacillota bacterium]